MRTVSISIFGSLLLALSAQAQVDAPRLGYLPDNGRIRPILGIAESAIVAAPLDAGLFARIAIVGETIVASQSDTGTVVLYRNGAFHPIGGATSSPDAIEISPNGSAAVLWHAARSTAEIVTDLRTTPRIRQVSAPFRPNTPPLAISDDGEWLAGIWPEGLFVFGRDRQPAALRIDGRPRALAFGAHNKLAVATSSGIYTIDDIGGNASVTTAQSISLRAAGIAFHGASLVTADAGGTILADKPADCGCAPEILAPLAPGVFRITGLHGGAARIYDARTGAVLFAPLSLEEASR